MKKNFTKMEQRKIVAYLNLITPLNWDVYFSIDKTDEKGISDILLLVNIKEIETEAVAVLYSIFSKDIDQMEVKD